MGDGAPAWQVMAGRLAGGRGFSMIRSGSAAAARAAVGTRTWWSLGDRWWGRWVTGGPPGGQSAAGAGKW